MKTIACLFSAFMLSVSGSAMANGLPDDWITSPFKGSGDLHAFQLDNGTDERCLITVKPVDPSLLLDDKTFLQRESERAGGRLFDLHARSGIGKFGKWTYMYGNGTVGSTPIYFNMLLGRFQTGLELFKYTCNSEKIFVDHFPDVFEMRN